MSYWYHISDADFRIPAENVEEAYRRVADRAIRDDLHAFVESADNLVDLLELIGIRAHETEGDYVVIWGGESKYAFRFPYIATLGDLVADDSYVVWQGEGGADFVRQIVVNGEVREQQGQVTFGI